MLFSCPRLSDFSWTWWYFNYLLLPGPHRQSPAYQTKPHLSSSCLAELPGQPALILWLLSPNVVFNYVSIVLFTSKDFGVRCWDENLLAQRERGATSWPWLFFFLPESSKGSLSRCPSSFSVLFLANSCRLLAGSTPWSKTEFINTVSGFTVLAQSRVSQCNQISRNM